MWRQSHHEMRGRKVQIDGQLKPKPRVLCASLARRPISNTPSARSPKLAGSSVAAGSIWPRISPAGNSASWTLKYIRPASSWATCAGVIAKVCSGLEPDITFGTPVKGNSTGALEPGGAQQWIWLTVAGPPTKPAQLSSTVIIVRAAFRITMPKPVAVLAVGS
jgi:hypothetical protein